MANTSVYFPDELLAALDRLAAASGVSRNRVIVESCRRAVERENISRDEFFSDSHLSKADLRLLRRGHEEFDRSIAGARRSRRTPPF